MATFGMMKTTVFQMVSGKVDIDEVAILINRAHRNEIESHPWFSLRQMQSIATFDPYVTGTATVTQGSEFVQFSDGGTVDQSWVDYYFWGGGVPAQIPPMKITQVSTGMNLIQLDSPWTNASYVGGFRVAPLFYAVEGAKDIYRVMANGVDLQKTSRAQINRIDPSRTATGGNPSTQWAPGPRIGRWPSVELWPLAVGGLNYLCEIKLAAVDMVDDGDLPQIPAGVVEEQALVYACQQAYANTGDNGWLQLVQQHKQDYARELETALVSDRQVQLRPTSVNYDDEQPTYGLDVIYNHNL